MLNPNKIFTLTLFSNKAFKKHFITLLKTEARVKSKSKTFSNQTHTSNFEMMSTYLRARGKPRIERVLIPSLSIIYPPYSKSRKRNFSVLFAFPVG